MDNVKVILDGQPAGVLPDVMEREGVLLVPLGHLSACIGAKAEVQGGQAVVCSGDLCVTAGISEGGDRGGPAFVPLSALSEAFGLRWELRKEERELRLTTRRGRTAEAGLRAGDPAPDFTLPDLSGRPVSLRDFRGRRTALYVWASW